MLIILNSSTYGKCFLNLCILFFKNIIFYLKKTLIQYSVNNFFNILMAEINKFSHYLKITLCPCHVNALSAKSQIVLCSAKFFPFHTVFFYRFSNIIIRLFCCANLAFSIFSFDYYKKQK